MLGDQPLVHIAAAVTALAALAFAIAIPDTDLRVGLFGLVGTLAGALATFEATQVTARGNRRAQKRIAGRLLQEDLAFARTRCRYADTNEKFWAPRHDLRRDGWERYREIVARELESSGEWERVAGAFEAMRAVQSKCDALRPTLGERPELGDRSRELIGDYLSRSDRALEALRRLSDDRPADEKIVAEGQ